MLNLQSLVSEPDFEAASTTAKAEYSNAMGQSPAYFWYAFSGKSILK